MSPRAKKPRPLSRAERNIAWLEHHCVVPKGPMKGSPLRLTPFQKRLLRGLYSGQPKRTAIWSFARKNAKTTLGGGVLLLHLCGPEMIAGTQLVSTALTRQQAGIIYEQADFMRGPQLMQITEARKSSKELYVPNRNVDTRYRALSSDADNNLGLVAVQVAFHDELGSVEGPQSDLYSAVETGMVDVDDPLSLIISTQAASDADLLSVLIDSNQADPSPDTIIELHTADPDLPWDKISTVRKANPNYGVVVRQAAIKKAIRDVKKMPSQENDFRRFHLNQRVTSATPFIPPTLWKACRGKLDMTAFEKGPVWGAIDLAEIRDLAAMAWACRRPLDNKWQAFVEFFMPNHDLKDRSKRERIPYDVWEKRGLITCTEGKTTDFDVIADRFLARFQNWNLEKVGYDRWKMKYLRKDLLRDRPDEGPRFNEETLDSLMTDFGQGYKDMSPALSMFEQLVVEEEIVQDDHPAMNLCVSGAVVQKDPANNRKLNKATSKKKIDGLVALVMALATAGAVEEEVEEIVTAYDTEQPFGF